jgi:uncharacterized damage-inducible protein DinB
LQASSVLRESIQGRKQVDEILKIKEKLAAARDRLLSAADGLDKEQWEWRPEDGRWSVRLVLAHVGAAQWSHLEVARRLVEGRAVEIPGFDLDDWNNAAVAKRADWSVEQVLADLDAGQRATFEFLDGLDAEKLAITGSHPALGEMSVGQVVRVIGLHDGLHRRDVLQLRREMGAPG